MITISLCMIVRNEEDTLSRVLDSAKDLVDEIIIVDTGSEDKTKEIAKQYTEKIYDFEWIDDFAAARNFSFNKATKEYIFYLDADDIMLEEDREKFKKLKEELDPSVDSVTMKYNVGFDKNGNVTFSYRRNRLVKRERNYQWYGPCHNYLVVSGNIINSDIGISHKKEKHQTDRNLKIYEKRLAKRDEFSPRDVFYYANELYDHKMYEKALENYDKFLNMNSGWCENKIYACGKVADYYFSVGDYENAYIYSFKSFEYDTPRAEHCCRIGKYFKQRYKYKQAAFWFELATTIKKPEDCWGFIMNDYWTWIPHMELCVCYYKLGDNELANKHNEMARMYNPNNEGILYNKKFFEDLGYK
ncbi:tetratricopeptide repeat-containing glycosyltransferase family 2 protein [Oceanirhabdus sp. W0125-5]|uniref:tetratricopeptide repeat-containing glycosyltransferase family 2 protein n=1 Tax=Oceanirhabdus sp. W0125-5 TaxID=2999116 RepID=UPI0022F326B4|nr:glycosyltransferase family 2 protein [Oceanirhabdus sp. W0125-5]WBW97271.1 glycosyltransferase family 2 protein [Oceanirhabdus sp. W0125-5]